MSTRSARLWHSELVGRPAGIVFTCPVGTTTILKTIYGIVPTLPAQVSIYVSGTGGTFGHLLVHDYAAGESALIKWEGWVVIEAGDQVNVSSSTSPIYTWGSGALLPLAAGVLPFQ